MNEATYHLWESGKTKPFISQWPGIIRFLGYDPHPLPVTLAERMQAKRRANGWTARVAAKVAGVDDGTWRELESNGGTSKAQIRARIEGVLVEMNSDPLQGINQVDEGIEPPV